jgi:hypothetical protein
MHSWLATVGKNFKDPPSEPTYLGQFHPITGQRLEPSTASGEGRGGDRARARARARADQEADAEEEGENEREVDEDQEDEEGRDMSEDSKRLEDAAADSPEGGRQGKAPAQKQLYPFTRNRHFVSESILSEELRMEVWRRVQQHGKSVRQVSVELGIDMRRVGAVVRLVELEKRMRAEVSPHIIPLTLFTRPLHDMMSQSTD